MTDKKHIVFIIKDWRTEFHYSVLDRITDKFVFIKGSATYHANRLEKIDIKYKLFTSKEEADRFLELARLGSTYDNWKYHGELAEEYKRNYQKHVRVFIDTYEKWDKHDTVKFCKHLRRTTMQSGSNPELNKTTCNDCGKVL